MEAHLSQNNIPTAVYDQLIEAVHDALPEMYRYVRLRRKMLGVEELHMYDVYTPLVSGEHASIPFDEAMEIVSRGLGIPCTFDIVFNFCLSICSFSNIS